VKLFWRRKPKSLQERFPQHAIGRGSYGDDVVVRSWNEGARLTIGAYCSLGHEVKIFLGGEHRTDWVTTYPFNVLWPAAAHIEGHPHTKGDVRIGNDVWIGAEAMILSGVTIGDGAIVGARAVVSRDVPPYAIAAGNPATVVKRRFDEATVARLLAVQWWHWPEERIARLLPLMLSRDIEAFLQAAEKSE
jgi:chloramphenicol O-acetyltransferase type B